MSHGSEKSGQDLPPCMIRIDKEGIWRHKGAEMIHREFIRLFYERMTLDDQGRYVIELNGERCYVEVEDTAFVVRRAAPAKGSAKKPPPLLLSLSDDTVEELVPATLRVGRKNVLYCSVKGGRFPARFTRAAYYQLAEFIGEGKGGYYLSLDGAKIPIFLTTPEEHT